MSKKLQLRGGTTTEHASFTGAVREVTVDTDKDTLVIHDGSTAGGFPLPRTDAEIRTAVEAATDSNVFTDADHSKLNAIEASADVTDTANVVAALTAGSNITIAANGTIAGAAQYTHPTHAGDDAAIDTGALSGATVISDLDLNITTDTLGHVTDANATVATRNLTLGDLGYTGATNANYITNNNQLTNGAGYTTSVGDITGVTAGTNLTGGGTSGGVTVNLTASPNITSLNVGSSQVISSGRGLTNISSIDTTTKNAFFSGGVGTLTPVWTQIGSTFTYAGTTNSSTYRRGTFTLPSFTLFEQLYWYVKYDVVSTGNYRGARLIIPSTSSGTGPGFAAYTYTSGAIANQHFTVSFSGQSNLTSFSNPPAYDSPTIGIAESYGTMTFPSAQQKSAGTAHSLQSGSTIHFGVSAMQSPVSIANISVKLYGLMA